MTAGLPLMKSVLAQLTKSVLIPLGLSAGMSARYKKEETKRWISCNAIRNISC